MLHKQLSAISDKILDLGSQFDVEIDRLYPYEIGFGSRVIESVIENDGNLIIAEWARQSGKTSTLGNIVPPLIAILPELAKDERFQDSSLSRLKGGLKVGIFAPTDHQAKNLFKKIKRNCASAEYKDFLSSIGLSVTSRTGNFIELSNYSFIQVQSAAPTSKIETFTFDLLLLDECQDIETSIIRKSLHPFLAARFGTLVKIGSPKADISDCDFYDCIQDAIADPLQARNYFHIDSDVVEKSNPLYGRFLEQERKRIGENSVEYQMSYKLVWPTEKGMFISDDNFFGRNEWEGRGIVGRYDWIPTKRNGMQFAGIDWAKSLGDTVVTIGDVPSESIITVENETTFTLNIIAMLLLHGDDYDSQYETIIEFLSNYGIEYLCVDSTPGSAGDPIYDKLVNDSRLNYLTLKGVPFSPSEKSRIYKQLQTELQGGRVHIAGGGTARRTRLFTETRKELIGLVKKHTASGYLVVNRNPNKKFSKDDIPDSICLCLDAAKTWMSEGVGMGPNILFAPIRNRKSMGVSRGRNLLGLRR